MRSSSVMTRVSYRLRALAYQVMGRSSSRWITDRRYRRIFKKNINYKSPKTLNEKIHWLKFYSDTSLWPMLADKFQVREFVRSRGGAGILTELYKVWDSVDDIDISELPQSFIVKLNDGCGGHLIVKDKSNWTNEAIRKKFSGVGKYGLKTGEYHYAAIRRKIIAEELLSDKKSPSDFLIDYRFWCCDGEPRFVNVHANAGGVLCGTYDKEWNHVNPFGCMYEGSNNKPAVPEIEKPISFNEMIMWARILSKGMPFVRVDFYEIDSKPVFGELTLTPGAGFIKHYSENFLITLGDHITLPKHH